MVVFKASDLINTNSWANAQASNEYQNNYSYDQNGNLMKLSRNATQNLGILMDRFNYVYQSLNNKRSNRLDYVSDGANMNYTGTEDIKNTQNSGNYNYDKLGQLTRDIDEGILEIEWRKGDKKIKRIIRSDANSSEMEFVYDPFGIRILKIEKPRTGGVLSNPSQWRYTFYAHDANGQTMAVYDLEKPNSNEGLAILREQHIYGASRIGMRQTRLKIYTLNGVEAPNQTLVSNTLGEKRV